MVIYATFGVRQKNISGGDYKNKTFCLVHWPSTPAAQWYITTCSVIIFIVPVLVIFYCYYKVFCKLREAAKGSRRLQRSNTTRAPYQRVTRSVQRVVLFHLLCWTPFWLFNLFSSIFRVRITSQLERIVVNIIHLFPYVNCALNPLLYAYRAENFRIAFKTMFIFTFRSTRDSGAPRPAAARRMFAAAITVLQENTEQTNEASLLQIHKCQSSPTPCNSKFMRGNVRATTSQQWCAPSATLRKSAHKSCSGDGEDIGATDAGVKKPVN
nr:7TM GPCR domain containing protein [Haemonchus contortus]